MPLIHHQGVICGVCMKAQGAGRMAMIDNLDGGVGDAHQPLAGPSEFNALSIFFIAFVIPL